MEDDDGAGRDRNPMFTTLTADLHLGRTVPHKANA